MSKDSVADVYLQSVLARFESLKRVGEAAIAQLSDEDIDWSANEECNSVRVLMQHLAGNMVSRWTDVLTTDGEKPTRRRDAEFVADRAQDRAALLERWEEGWGCLLGALRSFSEEDVVRVIQIRGVDHTVIDAINRQLPHVGYHVGQIVQIGKERLGAQWQSLSIPRDASGAYRPTTTNPWEPR